MNDSPNTDAGKYKVSYSKRVRDELRLLIARARSHARAGEVIAALEELDSRLRVYPQFGEPLKDLSRPSASLWIGVIPPLVVRYVLDEETRQVLVGHPIETLPRSGLE
jgi:hypothetical protein